jgi:hypothetical protein
MTSTAYHPKIRTLTYYHDESQLYYVLDIHRVENRVLIENCWTEITDWVDLGFLDHAEEVKV